MSRRAGVQKHTHSHIVIVLLSVIVGIGLASLWYHPRTTSAQPSVASEAPARLQAIEDEFVSIAERAKKAVVKIDAHVFVEHPEVDAEEQWRQFFEQPFPWFRGPGDGQPEERNRPRRPIERMSEGSGFIFNADGYILTNNHVVAGAKKIRVQLLDGRQFDATLVGTDKKTELAVIKIDAGDKLDHLTLGDSDKARVGSWAIAIGMPFQEEWSVTVGVVSARGRTIPGDNQFLQLTDLIQTDAAINPGNSGGPLLNIRGEVIGINVAIRTSGPTPRSSGVGYAVPSNTAKDIAPQLVATGHVARGYLGIAYTALTPDQREYLKEVYGTDIEHGMFVSRVDDDSPADKAGFKYEDVLIEFGGTKLEDTDDLQRIVAVTPPGTTIDAVVMREGKRQNLKITLGDVPAQYAGDETPTATDTAAKDDGAETALGITVENVDKATAEELNLPNTNGVVVTDIDQDSPAVGRPLSVGDVIIKVQGKDVTNAKAFKSALEKQKDQAIVGLTVVGKLGDEVGRRLVTIRPK